MLYYLIATFIFFVSLMQTSHYNQLNNSRSYSFSKYNFFFLIFIILGTIRWETGTDWDTYLDFFQSNETLNDYTSKDFEVGFSLLNFFVHRLSKSYTFYLFIYTTLIILIEKKNINNLSVLTGFSVYLYFCTYFGAIFAVRQLLAQAICYLSIVYIKDKKLVKFILITIIASLVHRSALIWLLAYFIFNKRISNNAIILLFVTCFCIGLFGQKIYPVMVRTFISPLITKGEIFNRIYYYTFYYTETYTNSFVKIGASIIKRMLFIPFFLLYRREIESKGKYMKGIMNLYLVGNCFYLLFSTSFVIFQRALGFFCSFEIYLLPCLIYMFKHKSSKMIFCICYFCYGLLKIYSQIVQFPDALSVYKTIF